MARTMVCCLLNHIPYCVSDPDDRMCRLHCAAHVRCTLDSAVEAKITRPQTRFLSAVTQFKPKHVRSPDTLRMLHQSSAPATSLSSTAAATACNILALLPIGYCCSQCHRPAVSVAKMTETLPALPPLMENARCIICSI